MRGRRLAVVSLALGALAIGLHCGSGASSTFTDPAPVCAAGVEGCGDPCTRDEDCKDALYCDANGRCAADCAPGSLCADGTLCRPRGHCPAPNFADAGANDGSATTDAICADTDVTLTKVLPKVLFLLDQSSSMFIYKFPNGDSNNCTPDCRWSVLKDVLIGPNATPGGLVAQLDQEAELGVEMYSATDAVQGDGDDSFLPPPTDPVCPRFNGKAFDGVAFKLGAASQIDALLRPATVDDDTPTGAAIRTVVGLQTDGGVDPRGFAAQPATTPRVLVLVTDGEPALCGENYTSDPAKAVVVQAVQETYGKGIRTFVIAIGDTSAQAEAHFKAVANAGQGMDPAAGDAGAIRPTTKQQLVDALKQVVLDARTCRFTLNGTVQPGMEQTGTVLLNGAPVAYGSGWKLVSPTELELVGAACTTLKTSPNATLSARFPCGAVTPGSPH